jgi:nucleoside-diphosphate-sugar epimerase
MSTVLVTGGSGFIASHCILQLLAAGHQVRATVRNLARDADIRSMLRQGGAEPGSRLTLFAADLLADEGWPEAVAGCDYVLHLASPLPPAVPKDENEIIVPAREGALRVLRAARAAGVRRVVLTSSFAAIGYGHPVQAAPFDETLWTDAASHGIQPYPKSKTLAEAAAWQFMQREGGSLELTAINPAGVFGPVLGPDYSSSILLVQRLMDGAVPGCPRLWFGVVDVRDVANLHIRAMTHPAARGERFIAVSGDFLRIVEMAKILRERLGDAARRVPKRELPDFLVRLAALRDPAIRLILPELGKKKNATSAKAQTVLGWSPRPAADALVATAESLIRLGLLKSSVKPA